MGFYAVTGSASGMGRAVYERLRAEGHAVVGVDIKDADVVADLSTAPGRQAAIDEVLAAAPGRLDGAVMAAGLASGPGPDRIHLITQVNYFGVVELLDGWRPALAAAGNAKVVVFSSNSTTTAPAVPRQAVRALLAGDPETAMSTARRFGSRASSIAYVVSKTAISHWVRRAAVTRDWAGAGIRLNAIAPGAILTPLIERQMADPEEAKRLLAFPRPIGGLGDAGQIADWAVFMLSDSADYLCGSVVCIDGGSEAYFRADDWPRSLPRRRIRWWRERVKAYTPYR